MACWCSVSGFSSSVHCSSVFKFRAVGCSENCSQAIPPYCHSLPSLFQLSTISVCTKLNTNSLHDYFAYATCMQQGTDMHCPATYRKYRYVTIAIIDLLLFDVFSIAMVAYILMPTGARSFWSHLLSRFREVLFKSVCQTCGRRKYISWRMRWGMERPTMQGRTRANAQVTITLQM